MIWPSNKKFAFTIIDETDFAFTEKVKSIYELLDELKFKTTKTVWVYDSADTDSGNTLEDESYKQFILGLQQKGFEIALHNISNDAVETKRAEEGLEKFKAVLGAYPQIQTNHSNRNNIYWGYKRFEFPLKQFYKMTSGNAFDGDNPSSPFFWGKEVKGKIKYIRNLAFKSYNILNADPLMPYYHYNKKDYSNYWFSTAYIENVGEFVRLLSADNISKLEKEGGLCIISTCMGENDFIDANGNVDECVSKTLRAIAQRDGYFVPATDILDHLKKQKNNEQPGYFYHLGLNIKWLLDKIKR